MFSTSPDSLRGGTIGREPSTVQRPTVPSMHATARTLGFPPNTVFVILSAIPSDPPNGRPDGISQTRTERSLSGSATRLRSRLIAGGTLELGAFGNSTRTLD